MRLGPKSRNVLEILAMLGEEAVEAVLSAPRLYRYSGCSSERSFEGRLKLIEGRGWIARERGSSSAEWVMRLTETGKAALAGGLDPERRWNTAWDGKWRTLSFDLPRTASTERRALKAWLQKLRFARLQGSVYVTPWPLESLEEDLATVGIDPRSVVSVTGSIGGMGGKDRFVERVWDLATLRRRYRSYLQFASTASLGAEANALADWLRQERELWRVAIDLDPLLPKELWPNDYPGPKALQVRRTLYQRWGDRILAQRA